MKKAAILLLFLAITLIPSLCWADDLSGLYKAANSEKYGTKFGGMLGRGLVNIATCFVDLIVHTVDGTKEGPPVVGTMTGLGSGLGCTALRVTSGALDVVTFWVPSFNGIPVSPNYHDCLAAEETAAEAPAAPPAEEAAPPLAPEDYAKPAAPARHRDTMEYVKK